MDITVRKIMLKYYSNFKWGVIFLHEKRAANGSPFYKILCELSAYYKALSFY